MRKSIGQKGLNLKNLQASADKEPDENRELPKRKDSGESQSSVTGFNIRSTMKSAILGMFVNSNSNKKPEKEAETKDEVKERPHEKSISPYAKHNINHGVMYTPDGEEIDTKKAMQKKLEDEKHLYPVKDQE